MSKLFFIDESGHDHKETPFEVRGGFVIHVENLKKFIHEIMELEKSTFGIYLRDINSELKGKKLLSKETFKHYDKNLKLDKNSSLKVKKFLENTEISKFKEYSKIVSSAKIHFVSEMLDIMSKYNCTIIASMIPTREFKNNKKPKFNSNGIRQDFKNLIDVYHKHLDRFKENGIIVIDENEKNRDNLFIYDMKNLYLNNDKYSRLFPVPFFVPSNVYYPIMIADICLYLINWSFRIEGQIESNQTRNELVELFLEKIKNLQYKGKWKEVHEKHKKYGIFISHI